MLANRFFVIIAIAALSASCIGDINSNQNSNATSNIDQIAEVERAANHSVEELGLIIKLPYEPVEASWRNEATGNNKITIRAVLLFTTGDGKTLIAEAEKIKPGQPVEVVAENWYPTELIAKSEMGEESKVNGKAYPAEAFFQPPYNSGRLIKIDETDHFILELGAQ
ncbi:hypothetical protein BH24ACI3_BH24ACI3_04260 [soil metagenome]